MSEGFVGLAEAATRKGVHYQTVRRAITRGDLKAMKVGGGIIIALEDLEGWQPHYKNAPRRYRQEWLDGTGPDAAAAPTDGIRAHVMAAMRNNGARAATRRNGVRAATSKAQVAVA